MVMRIQGLFLTAVFIGMCAISIAAHAQDETIDPEAEAQKFEAAREYEEAVPIEMMVNSLFKEFTQGTGVKLDKSDMNVIRQSINMKELRNIMIAAVMNNFTLSEITAMTRFYKSDEGQNIIRKLPAYMSEVTPAIQYSMETAVKNLVQHKVKQQLGTQTQE